MSSVVTRFAPSPTGPLHVGVARTALFSYLLARKNNGPANGGASKFILRIDDTDTERSRPEFEKDILENLAWLGLGYDEIFYQSKRAVLYEKHLRQLIDTGRAYISKETEGERGEVVRFKNPKTKIAFEDVVRGTVNFDTTELGDFVIAKSFHEPIYHFASVVDDIAMGITDVVRGEDHLSNTPRQILILEALGAKRPRYAHLPLILAPDRSKLSKRHGATSVSKYRKLGYLPEALINFLALLGWNPGTPEELFTLEELIAEFDSTKIQKGGAVFNQEKLDWFNHQYIQKLPASRKQELVQKYLPDCSDAVLEKIAPELLTRVNTFDDVKKIAEAGELDFYFTAPIPTPELLKTTEHLPETLELVSQIPDEQFTPENIKAKLWDFATQRGRGEVLWPMRVALTGLSRSPDPFFVAYALGKEETTKRLQNAIIKGMKGTKRGFFRLIFLILIAIILLGYFKVDIRGILEPIFDSDFIKDNLRYILELTKTIVTDYLFKPLYYIWSQLT